MQQQRGGEQMEKGAEVALTLHPESAISWCESKDSDPEGAHKRRRLEGHRVGVEGGNSPAPALGQLIEVLWEGDATYYSGECVGFVESTGKHIIEYEDGSVETLLLQREGVLHKGPFGAAWRPAEQLQLQVPSPGPWNVGRTVQVKWDLQGGGSGWYTGTIVRIRRGKEAMVRYDVYDGSEPHWIAFPGKNIKLALAVGNGALATPTPRVTTQAPSAYNSNNELIEALSRCKACQFSHKSRSQCRLVLRHTAPAWHEHRYQKKKKKATFTPIAHAHDSSVMIV
jgi:hypothetical protein